jgi:ParB family chromosome partitioning protein
MGSRGMGRGLAAILPDASEADGDLRRVPVATIRPNARQPRTRFDPESISALAASIAETGVIQPLVVCPLADGRYELIAGERRWRAAQEAGLETVPAVIRTEGEVERLQTALIENVAREDLNAVDAARACATLIEDLGVTKEELARRLGRSRPSVSNLIRILDLPDEALELIAAGKLSEGHGRALLQVRGNDERRRLAREATKRGWSVRETERRAKLAEGPRRAKVVSHPDTEAALAQASDELERALGAPVRVRPARRGIRAELHFDDLDALLDFARSAKPG